MIPKKEVQNNILNYIECHEHSPLFFYPACPITNLSDNNLDNIVIICLKLARYIDSVRKNGDKFILETTAGRSRSSIDIWRHIISYKSEITIFEVMESLYRQREWLIGQYCHGVRRRVFKLKEFSWGRLYLRSMDEYRSYFTQWKDIGSE